MHATRTPGAEVHQTVRQPRLSVVIATRNVSRTFERCMRSILEQHFTSWELLISDGGSTDDTVALIHKYEKHIAWWQSKADNGIYDAWNQALIHAKGDYVCFLGADDAWADPNVLQELFSAINSQTYDLVTSRGLIFSTDSDESSTFGSAWNYQRLGRRMVVCHPGLLHRRELFDTYGLFDTRYRIAGDLEFLLRLPSNITTKDVAKITVRVEANGVSRMNFYARLREQRSILSRCGRFGTLYAYAVWVDRLFRYPIARILRIPY